MNRRLRLAGWAAVFLAGLCQRTRILYTLFKPEEIGPENANEKVAATLKEKGLDTYAITESGCENLSLGVPRTVAEIEALMKGDGILQTLRRKAFI
jgi:hypothetical protein